MPNRSSENGWNPIKQTGQGCTPNEKNHFLFSSAAKSSVNKTWRRYTLVLHERKGGISFAATNATKNGLERHKADALTHFLFKNPIVVLKKNTRIAYRPF